MQTMIISAAIAGIVAILVTMAIEKWGGIIGGILGTLPYYNSASSSRNVP